MDQNFEDQVASPAVRKVAKAMGMMQQSPEGYMTVQVILEYNGLRPCSRMMRRLTVDREGYVTMETAQANMDEIRRKNPGLNLAGRFIKDL